MDEIYADGDGKISKTELHLFHVMSGGSPTEEDLDDIFLKADVSGDGVSGALPLTPLGDFSPSFFIQAANTHASACFFQQGPEAGELLALCTKSPSFAMELFG